MSRAQILKADFDKKTSVISISTPGDRYPTEIVKNKNIRGILFLSFGDTDPSVSPYKEMFALGAIAPQLTPLKEYQAKMILSFVEAIKDSVDHLVIHCDMGYSRSVGCKNALCMIYGIEDKSHIGNAHVKTSILKAAGYGYYEAD